jgi:hypothetical protein
MRDEPSFRIAARPEREFREGGVERTRGSVFTLTPDDGAVGERVENVLADERYTVGDWFDLPAPVYLVHDAERSGVFRVVRHDDRVDLHVMATTDADGLRAFYDRLTAVSDVPWSVDCETNDG